MVPVGSVPLPSPAETKPGFDSVSAMQPVSPPIKLEFGSAWSTPFLPPPNQSGHPLRETTAPAQDNMALIQDLGKRLVEQGQKETLRRYEGLSAWREEQLAEIRKQRKKLLASLYKLSVQENEIEKKYRKKLKDMA